MKILQINVVYGEGSTGKIVRDLHLGFIQRDAESFVIYSTGENAEDENTIKAGNSALRKLHALSSRISGVMYGGCIISTNSIIDKIEEIKPDVIILHCLNGHYVNIFRLINYLRSSQISTILVLHAEFMYTGNCGHSLECNKWLTGCGHCPQLKYATQAWFFDRTAYSWRKMKDVFSLFNNLNVISVSPWLRDRAVRAPILKHADHHVVLNGVNTNVFKYSAPHLSGIEDQIAGKKVVLHVTASFTDHRDDIKGGRYILELAKRFENEPVIFAVARNTGSITTLPDNIIDLGRISDQALLAQLYSRACVTLLTSKKETFSMVCAESLCCGTPIVGFKAGAPEMIAMPEYSDFVDFGDIDGLENALRSALEKTSSKSQISVAACEHYSLEKMVEQYYSLAIKAVQRSESNFN